MRATTDAVLGKGHRLRMKAGLADKGSMVSALRPSASGDGRSRESERGQALVEFALILPVFLLLVVGMLEFSRAWNLRQVMTDAAREGARRAVLADPVMDQDSVKAAMWRHVAASGYDPAHATMTIAPADSFKKGGANITIGLSLPYKFFVIPSASLTMKTLFTMRNE
jgi:Flp pilus assembly protein TadG